MKSPWTRFAAALVVGVAFGACSSSGPVADNGGGALIPGVQERGACPPGHEGCSCSIEGATAACGNQVAQSGDYVTCSVGTSACQGGHWGACVQHNLVTKSLSGATLSAGGLRPLSITLPCDDKCDPNGCTLTTSNANDVDASLSINAGDGGVTLPPPMISGCVGTQCQIAYDCPVGSPTTISGVVRDPAGVNPIYNALVYIPVDATAPLPSFPSGATCDFCAGVQQVQATVVTQTAADGSFTLPYAPSTDVAPGNPIPLVVQLGKWRREVTLPPVPKCATTPVAPDSTRLPRNASEGNLPRMAIATGSNDPFECLLLKMGIDPAEFEIPSAAGPGHVDFFHDNGLDFVPAAPPGTGLYGAPGAMQPYDVVILPCQGPNNLGIYANNLASYLNGGGRAFLTHFSFNWLATPGTNPFFGVANWHLNDAQYSQAIDTTIDQSLPKGQALATWLTDVGASTTPGHLSISSARHDVDSVNPPSQRWIYDSNAPGEPFYFSFDTPLGASADAGPDAGGSCGRAVFSDFHVSTADLVTSTTCTTNQDCGFTATCNQGAASGPGTCAPLPCAHDVDCNTGTISGYSCAGTSPGTCEQMKPCTLATQDSDCGSHICQSDGTCISQSCRADFECGNVEACVGFTGGGCAKTCVTNADCSAGELCTTGFCTGCLDSTFCRTRVCNSGPTIGTCSANASTFPLKCQQGPLTPQEDALEFMLLDLTSCDTAPPPPLVQTYSPLTFTEDFATSCPPDKHVVWRELDWQAQIPTSASITFTAQTTATPIDGGAIDWVAPPIVNVAFTKNSTTLPGVDFQLLDTGTTGVFNTNMPPVLSADNLRLTVTLSPTSNRQGAPVLLDWSVKADCLPSE
jgi:hypothetical protein